jgi:hypothetical protein
MSVDTIFLLGVRSCHISCQSKENITVGEQNNQEERSRSTDQIGNNKSITPILENPQEMTVPTATKGLELK